MAFVAVGIWDREPDTPGMKAHSIQVFLCCSCRYRFQPLLGAFLLGSQALLVEISDPQFATGPGLTEGSLLPKITSEKPGWWEYLPSEQGL